MAAHGLDQRLRTAAVGLRGLGQGGQQHEAAVLGLQLGRRRGADIGVGTGEHHLVLRGLPLGAIETTHQHAGVAAIEQHSPAGSSSGLISSIFLRTRPAL